MALSAACLAAIAASHNFPTATAARAALPYSVAAAVHVAFALVSLPWLKASAALARRVSATDQGDDANVTALAVTAACLAAIAASRDGPAAMLSMATKAACSALPYSASAVAQSFFACE